MTQPTLFGKLPLNAASNIDAYSLHIPASEVKHMRDLLRLSPVADSVYENSLPDGDRRLGVRRDWLAEAKRVWETEFNWQATSVELYRPLILLQESNRRSHQFLSEFPGLCR